MRTKITILTLFIALAFMSFTSRKPSEKSAFTTGTFSTCSCDSSSINSLTFGLTLNDDNTFHYFNYSNPSNKIDVKGNWFLKKNTVLLKDYPTNASLENKWVIDKSGKCLKSKTGLSFTRLCNTKACN
ncbi:MAG: hypothetical protein ACRCYO_07440 [Bacteroidia bacterium]